MNDEIRKRIEQVRNGKVPEEYIVKHGYCIPLEWNTGKLRDSFFRLTKKNGENCENVLTISAQQGLINQKEYYNHSYASENTQGYSLLAKGDYAYNKSYSDGYPFGAIKRLEKYEKGIVSPLYICFSPDADTNSDFYNQYFEAGLFNREIYYIAQEGARNHGLLNVAVEDFFDGYIISPPSAEQQKISEILVQCDKVITLKQELLDEKRKQKKWLMQNLLNPESGVRLSGFEGEWENVLFGTIGTTYGGLSGKSKDDFGYGKPYVPYLNIFQNSIIDISQLDYVSIAPNEAQNKVKYGDIFFTTSSETPDEVGMSSVLLTDVDELYLNSFCFGFRLNGFYILLPNFAAYYFRGDYFRGVLNFLAQGATRFNLSKNNLMKCNITLPSIEEQAAIANILFTADKEIDLMEQELAAWKEKKKGLAQLLLTGLVRV